MITDDARRGFLTTETHIADVFARKISDSCDNCLGEQISQVKCVWAHTILKETHITLTPVSMYIRYCVIGIVLAYQRVGRLSM